MCSNFKLFDALIQPVASYGCQVWLPSTGLYKLFNDQRQNKEKANIIAKDPVENLHLSFLKWTMNVNKTTSNAAVWGDCGRVPLAITMSKQVYNYKETLEQMDDENVHSLARHAFKEQKDLKLSWFKNLEEAKNYLESAEHRTLRRPSQIRSAMKRWFLNIWQEDRATNRKLTFYNSIKHEFEVESYLNLDLKGSDIKRIAQLRTISTNLTSKLGDMESTVKSFATGSACTARLTTLKHLTSSWNSHFQTQL